VDVRLVSEATKSHTSHLILRDTLHWLQPVDRRIEYKIAMMTFSCVRRIRPVSFHDICCPVAAVEGHAMLRSADDGQLVEPRTKGKHYGPRSFRLVTFRVRRSRGEMYIAHGRLCVCLSVPRRILTLLHGPGCELGE